MDNHAAADVYPMMTTEELNALAADIKANGQRVTVKLLGGKILDGRNRWEACKIAGVAPRSEEVTTNEPLSYAHSLNINTRVLTPSQRAMVASKELEYLAKHPSEHGLDYLRILKKSKLSARTVRRANRVRKRGTEELQDKVSEGEISVRDASVIAGHTAEQQKKLIKQRQKEAQRSRQYRKANITPPLKGAKVQLRKEARSAFSRLVSCINSLGMFEELYDSLDKIRTRIEG